MVAQAEGDGHRKGVCNAPALSDSMAMTAVFAIRKLLGVQNT
jgi:hypothetical protein